MTEVTDRVTHAVPNEVERGRWRRRLRSSLALVLALALLGMVAGWWVGTRQASSHTATAVVLVSPLEGNPFSPTGSGSELVNLETEAQLVRSDAVALDVIADLGLDTSPTELLEHVTAEVPPNTQIVRITVEGAGEDEAVDQAQAFADSFLQFRRSRARTAAGIQADQIAEQVANQQQELNTRTRRLADLDPASGPAVLLRQQIVEATTQLGELRAELAALEATRTDPGEVVTPATPPTTGWLSSTPVLALAGLIAGAGAGLLLLAIRSRRDDRVRDVADLDGVGVPVLGEITDGAGGADLSTSAVRSAVLALLPQRPLVLAMVGIEGEVRVADELAWSMARARHEVVHVELESGLDDREGMSDLLLDVATLDDVLRPVTPHLQRIPAGRSADRLRDLLGGPQMQAVLTGLGERADVVVVEAGAVGEPRAAAVVRHTHGVVLEVRAGHTRLPRIAAAREAVWSAGGEVVGLVLVHRPPQDLDRGA